jgi:glycine/D-amino acid oxidase-like deaminating enzyme
VKYGIHVMASQNECGEVIVGDSHEYDADISIFNSERIDSLILEYLRRILDLPDPSIAARWHGIYAKHPAKSLVVESPCDGVTVVSAPGGAGMTMSFGFAADWWDGQ